MREIVEIKNGRMKTARIDSDANGFLILSPDLLHLPHLPSEAPTSSDG